jgi:hypothetical protein
MGILPKAIYMLNAIPIKMILFIKVESQFKSSYGSKKRPQITKAILSQK